MREFLNWGGQKLLAGLCCLSAFGYATEALASKFEPGIGVGAEYTDNATLSSGNKKSDTITTTYIGAKISHDAGPLKAEANTSFTAQRYTRGTFSNQNYFNLNTLLDWEMVKDQFHWTMRDIFNQRPVTSTDVNTPNNVQNSNIFTLGGNWVVPVSAKTQFSVLPEYRRFYYQKQNINNRQYSLAVNWLYHMYRLTSVGLSANYRQVNYDAQSLADTRFSTLQLNINGKRARSTYALNMGVTNVGRNAGKNTNGFSGNLYWLLNMSGKSTLQTSISTSLTDASSGSLNANIVSNAGDFNNVQISAGVIRNKLFRLAYLRKDGTLNSRIWTEYRQVLYDSSPTNNRKISTLGINFNYPVTTFLSSGLYVNYFRDRLTELFRTDKRLAAGVNFSYQHSRKLRSTLNISYRQKVSTSAIQEYTEGSIFYNLVYGFGRISRPTRSGISRSGL